MTDITDEQADEIFRARLVGKSIRTLAKRFGLTTGEVAELVESMCQPVSPAMRRAVLMLDLERLEILGEVFFEKAMAGDVAAAGVSIRLQERRAQLLGLDVPAASRSDAVVQIAMASPETTTDRIRAALEHLAQQRLPPPSGNGQGEEPDNSTGSSS
jgi:hypothetical protein